MFATAVVCSIVALVGVQFARVIGDNVRMARDLHRIQGDVARLSRRRDVQLETIARLRQPGGSIPEIHDRLRLVLPNEAIVFIQPRPTAHP